MQSCEELISAARQLLLEALQQSIITESLSLEGCYLKMLFRDGSRLFVTYNKYNEYSYQYLYSLNKYDRERFDNYDKHWDVRSQPHHFHSRGSTVVEHSPMMGDPQHDIPILINFLKKRLKI